MSNLKRQQIRSRQYLNASKGEPCAHCSVECETVVPAHYSGHGAHMLGKGAGIKAGDLFVASLCMSCHSQFDQYTAGRDYEQAFAFCMAIFETQQRRVEQGLLIVKGVK